MDDIFQTNAARELQKYVCEILNEDEALSAMGAVFFPEDSLDIDYRLREQMSRQGLACIVMTPNMSYCGQGDGSLHFDVTDMTVQAVENPSVNRARLKKLGLSAGTAFDVCDWAMRRLGGPEGGHWGEFCPKGIEQGTDENLIVCKATFDTQMAQDPDAVLSGDLSGGWVRLPYVYMTDLQRLSAELLENLGHTDYDKLFNKPTIGGHTISGEIKGLISSEGFALSDEIPTKTSQLENDSNFLTAHQSLSACVRQPESDLYGDTLTTVGKEGTAAVGIGAFKDSFENWRQFVRFGWDAAYNLTMEHCQDGKNRLYIGEGGNSEYVNEVPIKSDLPTKTSQLTNDSGYPNEADPKHFLTWFAPETSSPNKWYVNFGSSSSGGISLVSDNDDPAQSYIDIADNKITVPGEDDEDDHLKFNDENLAFADEIPTKTSQLTNDSNFATTGQIPTKTSQLTNDSGYLTQHQSLSNCVTLTGSQTITGAKTFNDTLTLGANTYLKFDGSHFTEIQTGDRNGTTRPFWMIDHGVEKWFASTDEIPTKTSQLTNNSGYATQDWISAKNYATKGNTTRISEFFNDSGYITQSSLPNTKKLYSSDETQYVQGDLEIYTMQTGSDAAYWNISESPNNGYWNDKHLEETDDVSNFTYGPPPDKAWRYNTEQTTDDGDTMYIYLYKVNMDETNTLWFLCWYTTLLGQVLGTPNQTQLVFPTDMGSFTMDLTASSSNGGFEHTDDVATKSYVDGLVGDIETILAGING